MWGARGKNEQVEKSWVGVECSLPAPSLSFSLKFRISVYYFFQGQTLLRVKENGGALAWPLMIPKAHNDLVLQPLPGKSREGPTGPTQESNNNWWVFPQDSALNNQKTFKLTILTLSLPPRHLNQPIDQYTKLKNRGSVSDQHQGLHGSPLPHPHFLPGMTTVTGWWWRPGIPSATDCRTLGRPQGF